MNSDEIQAFEKETEPLNQAIVWYRINLRPTNSSELKKLLESPEETVNAELDQALRSLDLDLSHPDLDRSHSDLDRSHPDLDTIQLDSTCQNEIRTLLMELRVPELKRLTKEFEYDIPSNLNKAELIDTLVTMRPTTKSFISKASQKAGAGATPNQNPIHLTLALNKITELAEKLKLLKADQKLPNKYQKSIQRCNALVNKVAKRYLQNSTKLSSKYKSLTDNKQTNSEQTHKRQKVKSKHANKQQTDSKFFSQRGGDVWMGVGTGVLALFALVALLWRRWKQRPPVEMNTQYTYAPSQGDDYIGTYAGKAQKVTPTYDKVPENPYAVLPSEARYAGIPANQYGVLPSEARYAGIPANPVNPYGNLAPTVDTKQIITTREFIHPGEELFADYKPPKLRPKPTFGPVPGYGDIPVSR